MICSLHQPSFEILALMDKVIILDEGETVFYVEFFKKGPASEIVPVSKSLEPDLDFPDDINPVEHLLKLIHPKKNDSSGSLKSKLLDKFRDEYSSIQIQTVSPTIKLQPVELDDDRLETASNRKVDPRHEEREAQSEIGRVVYGKVPEYYKFYLLIKRNLLNFSRDKKTFFIFYIQSFFALLLACLIYANLRRDYDTFDVQSLIAIKNRIGSFFFICLNYYISFLGNSAFKMEMESHIVYKDLSAGLYKLRTYFWAKSLVDLVFLLPPVILQIPLVRVFY